MWPTLFLNAAPGGIFPSWLMMLRLDPKMMTRLDPKKWDQARGLEKIS